MKTQRKNISGKAVLLHCFSTPWESTELLTIYLSNLWNKTTLGNCQNIINKQQQTAGCFIKCQQGLLSPAAAEATTAGFGTMSSRARDGGPLPVHPQMGDSQSHSHWVYCCCSLTKTHSNRISKYGV